MEILKPIFCATALMGMYITGLLMSISIDTDTNYSTFMPIFPKLNNDMITTHPHYLLQTFECVVSFALTKIFKQEAPTAAILNSFNDSLQEYRTEVGKVLSLFLKAFSSGLLLFQFRNFTYAFSFINYTFINFVSIVWETLCKNNLSTVSLNIVLKKCFGLLCDDVLAHTKNCRNLCIIFRLSEMNGIKKKNDAVWTEGLQWKGSPRYTHRRTKTFWYCS